MLTDIEFGIVREISDLCSVSTGDFAPYANTLDPGETPSYLETY